MNNLFEKKNEGFVVTQRISLRKKRENLILIIWTRLNTHEYIISEVSFYRETIFLEFKILHHKGSPQGNFRYALRRPRYQPILKPPADPIFRRRYKLWRDKMAGQASLDRWI